MKILAALFAALMITLSGGLAQAKPDTVELYTEAVMIGDVPALETLLAPNYWHINANGHIEDKEHFINTIKNKELFLQNMEYSSKLTTKTEYTSAERESIALDDTGKNSVSP